MCNYVIISSGARREHDRVVHSRFLILWSTIDPVPTLAIFAAITSKLTLQQRRKTALNALIYASIVLVGAIVAGHILLSAMEIRLISLRVAGAILLFLVGLQMIFRSTFTSNSA